MDLTTEKKNGYLHTIEALTAKQALNQSVAVDDYGGEAVAPSDKRKLVAGLGFCFGGILPSGPHDALRPNRKPLPLQR